MSLLRKFHKHLTRFKMFLDQSSNYSYAQEGEDPILTRYFGDRKEGFYIDIGAHHPKLYSNTYLFYTRGWHGVNIDAMPGSMNVFKQLRKRDINIEAAISNTKEELTFYTFSDPALNTFSKELADQRENPAKNHYLTGTKTITTQPLSEVLDKVIPANQKIDFLTIDIEGYDLNALQSLDFTKHAPELILVEVYSENLAEAPIDQFLQSKGYYLYAKAVLTCIYQRKTS